MPVNRIRFRDDDGVTLTFVVLSIFIILAFVALAIDGGAAFLDIRRSQNAADNAALAAALQDCSPTTEYGSTAAAAGAVATSNGYPVTTYSGIAGGQHTVGITTESGLYFLPVLPFGPGSFTVNVSATADCVTTPGVTSYALFGGGQCGNTVSVSSADISVGDDSDPIFNGGVYSGEFARFTGSSPEVEGPVYTVGTGNRNEVPEGTPFSEGIEPQPFPEPLASLRLTDFSTKGDSGDPSNVVTVDGYRYVNFGTTDIDRNNLRTAGHLDTDGRITTQAVFVTTGDIDLTLTGTDPMIFAPGVTATFVAGGYINVGKADFGAAQAYYRPDQTWGPGLLLFSWGLGPPPRCGDSVSASPNRGKGIATASNGISWTGIIFAPHGEAKISAASGSTNNGPIYAHNIDLSGSSYTLGVIDDDTGPRTYRVVLVDES